MIITVLAKYWGAFMRTTLRFDLQQHNSSQQRVAVAKQSIPVV